MKKIVIVLVILGVIIALYVQHGIAGPMLHRYIERLNNATSEEKRFYALGPAAKVYFNNGNKEEAKKLAEELKSLLEKYRGNPEYGSAIQDVNIILGRIAISEGRTDEARECLIKAAEGPATSVMKTFGPNMSLAKDLLEKGERDVVLQYFELCRKFWKLHPETLDEWAQQVKNGEIPDFGANLIY